MTGDEAFRSVISTPEGRRRLAAAMVRPVRAPKDYKDVLCLQCGMVMLPARDHSLEECVVYRVMES